MGNLHDALVVLLLVGGVFVEVALTRFLVVFRRAKQEEVKLLLRPDSIDPMPSEMLEVIHARADSGGWLGVRGAVRGAVTPGWFSKSG
tara:strand:- start:417 stop:680 length:264 start_codon:yes stop_codon:yes gene_type:complete